MFNRLGYRLLNVPSLLPSTFPDRTAPWRGTTRLYCTSPRELMYANDALGRMQEGRKERRAEKCLGRVEKRVQGSISTIDNISGILSRPIPVGSKANGMIVRRTETHFPISAHPTSSYRLGFVVRYNARNRSSPWETGFIFLIFGTLYRDYDFARLRTANSVPSRRNRTR